MSWSNFTDLIIKFFGFRKIKYRWLDVVLYSPFHDQDLFWKTNELLREAFPDIQRGEQILQGDLREIRKSQYRKRDPRTGNIESFFAVPEIIDERVERIDRNKIGKTLIKIEKKHGSLGFWYVVTGDWSD